MKVFGLIGFPLTHSFSQKYFTEKFRRELIQNVHYENFEIKNIDDLPALMETYPDLHGLNVTIPYKQAVMRYVDELDYSARKVGAVNVLKINSDRKMIGFNSDYYGFRASLETWLEGRLSGISALVLGTGGASRAVKAVLEDSNIAYKTVSRDMAKGDFIYYDLMENPQIIDNHTLIINTTPLGMFPQMNEAPQLPYDRFNSNYFLYDLIYNPEETLYLKKGKETGANIKNGMEMLILQAEKSWEIWNM